MAYSFKAQVAARGFHVYRNITWTDVKQGDSVSVETETNEESKKLIHIAVRSKHLLVSLHN